MSIDLSTIQRIEELDFKSKKRYEISSFEERILPLIKEYQILAIGGAFFGDEGKGKLVDILAQYVDFIARLNSGENAGHSVYFNGKEYVFHLAPSGLFIPGKQNLINSECVLDPITFLEELQPLKDDRTGYLNNLIVGNVHLVTPYHKLLDFLFNPNNHSTLKGMAPIHATKAMRNGLRLDDLFASVEHQEKKLIKDMKIYNALKNHSKLSDEEIIEKCCQANSDGINRMPEHILNFLKADDKIGYIIQLYNETVVNNPHFPKRGDISRIISQNLKEGKKGLFEASQSKPLSGAYDKFSTTSTSADTSLPGILASAGVNISKYRPLFLNVHKVPSSKVGAGVNPSGFVHQTYFSEKDIKSVKDLEGKCTNFDEIQKQYWNGFNENGIFIPTKYKDKDGTIYWINEAMAITSSVKHGEFGATTKKPRVLSLFDCVINYDVMDKQGPLLSISAVDRLEDYDKFGITIAYVYNHPDGLISDAYGVKYKNGDIIKAGDQLPHENVLKYCSPIVKIVDGLKNDHVSNLLNNENKVLPEPLQEMFGIIEHFSEAEIFSFGNGKKREDLIYVKEIKK